MFDMLFCVRFQLYYIFCSCREVESFLWFVVPIFAWRLAMAFRVESDRRTLSVSALRLTLVASALVWSL